MSAPGSTATPSTAAPARWRIPRALLVLLVAFGVFVAGYTGAYFEFNGTVLGSFISGKVNHSVRGKFTLGRASYPYWGGLWSILTNVPAHIEGADYQLHDPDGHLVLDVPYVEARVHLQELIGSLIRFGITRQFHITLHFEDAHVPAGFGVVAPTRATWGTPFSEMNVVAAMSARKIVPPDGSELHIIVDHMVLDHVHFAMAMSNADGQAAWSGRVDDARIAAQLEFSTSAKLASPEGPALHFQLRTMDGVDGSGLPDGTLRLGTFEFPLTDVKVARFGSEGYGTPAAKRGDLGFSVHALSLGADAQVDGALLGLFGTEARARLGIVFTTPEPARHPSPLVALLPDPIPALVDGEPHGSLHIEGPFTAIVIDGDVAGLHAIAGPQRVSDLAAHMHLGAGPLVLAPVTGRVARGKLESRATVDFVDGNWGADTRLIDVDPAFVTLLPPAAAKTLAGRLNARVRTTGHLLKRADHVEVQVVSATLERAGARGQLPRRIDVTGQLTASPQAIEIHRLAVGADGATLALSGQLRPSSGAFDALVSLIAPKIGPLLADFGFTLPLSGSVSAAGRLSGQWPRPHLSLDVRAEKLALAGLGGEPIDQLLAHVMIDGQTLHVEQLSAAGYGGTVEGDVQLQLFGTHGWADPLAVPTITGQLSGQGLNLGPLLGFRPLVATASVKVALSGSLAHPEGDVALNLPTATLFGDRYRDGRFHLKLDPEGIHVAELQVERVSGGKITGSGGVDWQSHYQLALSPVDFPVRAIPGVAALPVLLDGLVSGRVTIKGDSQGWMPDGELALKGFQVRDALLGDGTVKLAAGGDSARVTGRFFDNVTVEGDLTPLPSLALVLTLRFNDLALETLFPELKLLGDVRGTATGEARIHFDLVTGISGTLTLAAINLELSGTEEDGQLRHLLVRNRDPIVVVATPGMVSIKPAHLVSALGDFFFEVKELSAQKVDARMTGKIGLELLEYFFRSAFDHTDGNADVDLTLKGDPLHPQPNGSVVLHKVVLRPRGLDRNIIASGRVDWRPGGVEVSNFDLTSDGAVAHLRGQLALDGWHPGSVTAHVDGQLSAKLLQWLLPDRLVESGGHVTLSVDVAGQWQKPRIEGLARLENVLLQVRRFDHEIVLRQGTIAFSRDTLTIGCPTINGSKPSGCLPVEGALDDQGQLGLDGVVGVGEDFSFRRVDLSMWGNELRHSTSTFTIALSPRLRLTSSDGVQYALSGRIDLVEGRYTQKFDIFNNLVLQPRAVEVTEPFWQGEPRLETMTLDLRAASTGPLNVDAGFATLTGSAVLSITGTLSDPRLGGSMQIDEGGIFNLQSNTLTSDQGHIYFAPDKRIPEETPTLDLSGQGVCTDRSDTQHTILIKVTGTAGTPQMTMSSLEGWDQSTAFLCLASGRSPDDLRRAANGTPAANDPTAGKGLTAAEGISKFVTGSVINQILSDPLRKVIGFDLTSIEFGQSSLDVRLCKRFGRFIKTCGQGELGFLGSSKVEGSAELKLSDYVAGLVRLEYLTQGIDTFEESPTRLKLELNLRLPLGN